MQPPTYAAFWRMTTELSGHGQVRVPEVNVPVNHISIIINSTCNRLSCNQPNAITFIDLIE